MMSLWEGSVKVPEEGIMNTCDIGIHKHNVLENSTRDSNWCLSMLPPAMETLDELGMFLVFHGQQQFSGLIGLFAPQVLDVNL